MRRLELQPVLAVADPPSRRADELAGTDDGSVPNHGDKVALSAGFDPEETEPVLGVVVGDALHQPRQCLGWCCRAGRDRLSQTQGSPAQAGRVGSLRHRLNRPVIERPRRFRSALLF
jgi:hypothetical protein